MISNQQQAIILTSIIGTILKEYDDKEKSKAVSDLQFDCMRFMSSQSGTKFLPFIGTKVVDNKKHANFIKTVHIGDTIWKKSIDRYAKQSITIEATALIQAVYDFNPQALKKYVHISEKKIKRLTDGATEGDEKLKLNGTIIGGYLTELLSEAMGQKVNGRLKALRAKVERKINAH